MRKEAKTYIVYIFPFLFSYEKKKDYPNFVYGNRARVELLYEKNVFSLEKSYSLLALYIKEKNRKKLAFRRATN